MSMTPEQIAAAWALVNAATEGPWIVDYEGEPHAIATEDEWQVCKLYSNCGYPEDRMSSNAAFIAAARELFPQLLTALEAERAKVARLVDTFYIDCEFDGHNGPLLSIAMVRGDGYGIHLAVIEDAKDPWVVSNVVSVMAEHRADESYCVPLNLVGTYLRLFIGDCQTPTIIADSLVDIGRFCRAVSTGKDGQWQSTDFPQMTFIVRNVDCYPTTLDGAIQHNAWWDAMALRAALTEIKETDHE